MVDMHEDSIQYHIDVYNDMVDMIPIDESDVIQDIRCSVSGDVPLVGDDVVDGSRLRGGVDECSDTIDVDDCGISMNNHLSIDDDMIIICNNMDRKDNHDNDDKNDSVHIDNNIPIQNNDSKVDIHIDNNIVIHNDDVYVSRMRGMRDNGYEGHDRIVYIYMSMMKYMNIDVCKIHSNILSYNNKSVVNNIRQYDSMMNRYTYDRYMKDIRNDRYNDVLDSISSYIHTDDIHIYYIVCVNILIIYHHNIHRAQLHKYIVLFISRMTKYYMKNVYHITHRYINILHTT